MAPQEESDFDAITNRCMVVLKRRREQLGLSQRDLARDLGKAQPVVAKIENNPVASMQFKSLLEIAYALGLPLWKVLKEAEGDDQIHTEKRKAPVDGATIRALLRAIQRSLDQAGETVLKAEKVVGKL